MDKPLDGETVWIEYPEGRRFRAAYDADTDTFAGANDSRIAAMSVANWSRQQHEDTDISDDPKLVIKGKLTRD
jgi:hypothetical protein